ncbi:MAG: hypothetical protein HY320_08920 [Armatimonadetes bacterium]|nr:hypothetical protein [Armatimonadota bacterium]
MQIRAKEFSFFAERADVMPADLEVINQQFALTPLQPEQVYVRKMAICNDQYDRTGERFPLMYLERFQETLVGKALLIAHDRTRLPLGRFFRTQVVASEEAGRAAEGAAPDSRWLMTWVYMVKTPANHETRAQLDGGVYSHASIGFRWADLLCDLCGRSYFRSDCPHVIGQSYEGRECTATYGGDPRRVEAVEGSLVYLGTQYGAVVTKSDDRVAEKALLGRGEVGGESLYAALPEELERLKDEAARLRPLAADGDLYREDLKAEIMRLAGCLGAEQEAQFLSEALAGFPAARWKRLRDEYQKRFDAKFPPTPLGQLMIAPPARREDERGFGLI